ncbi:sensor histidine kinase [Azospirillum sp.]|uniref:sensor histidine kinase n=1 Tax=Azospirillum sp. TaxID=34012 RepID=UPI002D459B06|nr:PAS-domain containing protein [Azospirillum sp.]HYD69583.1 PAS-domain containing protein [Azospirillum sp.]
MTDASILALLQDSLARIAQGLLVVDRDQRVVFTNAAYRVLFDVPDALVVTGRPLADLMRHLALRGEYGPGDVERLIEERTAPARDGAPWSMDRQRPDGSFLHITGAALDSGGYVFTFTDVTERVLGAARLEATVAARTEQLRHSKEQAEAALATLRHTQERLVQAEKMAALGQLVTGIAHEINTPVGNILTAASYLEERLSAVQRAAGIDLGEALEAARLILDDAARTAGLVDAFKRVMVDTGGEERRSFDLGALIAGALAELGDDLGRTGHRVALSCPDGIVMDSYPEPLVRVLNQLLVNSLVHGYEKGRAGTLTLAVERCGDGVDLRYADDGRGIPADLRARIFDPFFTTRRGAGGMGLGLHIAYNLVVGRLGGEISVYEPAPRGAGFLIRLPLVAP